MVNYAHSDIKVQEIVNHVHGDFPVQELNDQKIW